MLFSGRHLLITVSTSPNRMVYLDTTKCLEGGQKLQIGTSGFFGADVAIVISTRPSASFTF